MELHPEGVLETDGVLQLVCDTQAVELALADLDTECESLGLALGEGDGLEVDVTFTDLVPVALNEEDLDTE
jgi:hypothetical protein